MFNDFVTKFFSRNNNSCNVAKKRLQFALMYDKLEVSDETLVDLQNDIVEVISRYFEIDRKDLQLDINRAEDSSALVLKTPILAGKRRGLRASGNSVPA
ncbi:MAG: cell division topological specificity factor MinE [Nitrospinota bacterium]